MNLYFQYARKKLPTHNSMPAAIGVKFQSCVAVKSHVFAGFAILNWLNRSRSSCWNRVQNTN